MSSVRLSVGVDISKDNFQGCLIFRDEKSIERVLGNKSFGNRKGGFEALLNWVKRLMPKGYVGLPTYFVMEATGVYYEQLSYFLHDLGLNVSVQLASNVKNFAKSHNRKTKTDKVDAQLIAQMGIERTLQNWTPPKPIYRQLRQLTRERAALVGERTMIKNQEHALKSGYEPVEKTLERLNAMVDFMDAQIADIEIDIKKVVASDQDLAQRVKNVCTIKGVELITAATVISEYNGFELFFKKGQVVSFAGLDVVKNESGSVENKHGRISKKGNTHVRRILYMPALSAIRWNQDAQNLAQRITDRTNIKMKGVVAVQRKLLVLIYKLFVNNEPFDTEYHKKQLENVNQKVKEHVALLLEELQIAE